MDEFDRDDPEPEDEFQAPEESDPAKGWPKWRYGPDGQSEIFHHPKHVPTGWHDHPSKAAEADNKAKMAKVRSARKSKEKAK